MQMIRLFTGDDGVTHLEDMEPKDMRFPATEVVIRAAPSALPSPWHNAPLRQILIVRTGNVKVEVEDGDVRQLAPGDMVLEEDLTGKGHRGIPVDDQPVILNAVVLG
jgi:quercetin dioxygenase-like cupin family protein